MNNIKQYYKEKNRKMVKLVANLGTLSESDFEIKFIDFGLSKQLIKDQVTSTPVGVPQIIPPEMEKKDAVEFDRRVDVWNTGILFYMLLYKKLMF